MVQMSSLGLPPSRPPPPSPPNRTLLGRLKFATNSYEFILNPSWDRTLELQSPHPRAMNTPPSSSIKSSQSQVMSPKHKPPSNDVRPFQCQVPGCYQRFKRKFTLAEHTKTHTGERPFVCPVATCGKTFSTSGNLSRHKSLHPWLKSLSCLMDGCGRSFSNDISLERHLLTHFKGPRSLPVCPVASCGKTFSTMGSLTRHTKQQHDPNVKTQRSGSANYSSESDSSVVAHFESRSNPAGRRFSPLIGEESVVSDDELREFLQDLFAEDSLEDRL